MKQIIIITFTIIFGIKTYSQTDIISSFNTVEIGRNLTLCLKKDINNHSLIFGIKYNINRKVHDNQNNVFKNRFYARDIVEHFGLNAGYQYNFALENSQVKPFLFYDFQFTHSHTRNHMYLPYDFDVNGDVLYKAYLEYFGPFFALEHNFGMGFNVPLSKRVYLHQKIGAGIVTIHGYDEKRPFTRDGSWEFGYIISAGLGYRLK